MVYGIESFREAFIGYENCYTIIGGTACDILMSEQNFDFRATKDIDIILLLEAGIEGFAKVLWEYIKSGGYRAGWRNSEELHYYRFTEPSEANYPVMIELFSRNPGYRLEIPNSIITPIHISEDISSLSAIMLNDEYYRFMLEGRKIINGIGVLSAEYLIPFKIRAFRDLSRRKTEGLHVNSDDLKKHRNDVFRLLQIIPADTEVITSAEISEDIVWFLENVDDGKIILSNLGVDMKLEFAMEMLGKIYKK